MMLKTIAKEHVALRHYRDKYKNSIKEPVSIIVPTCKPKFITNIFDNYRRLNYPNKELIIVLNGSGMDIGDYIALSKDFKDVRIFSLDKNSTLGDCLNFGIEKSKFDFIAKMDDDDFYGSNYLIDMMNIFRVKDTQVVGKMSSFVYFADTKELFIRDFLNQNRYVNLILGSTIIMKKFVYKSVPFRRVNIAEDLYFYQDCIKKGFKIFAGDRYNYVCVRHKNLDDHTWKINSRDLKKMSHGFVSTGDFRPIIEV